MLMKSKSQSLLQKASAVLLLSSHPSTPSLAFQSVPWPHPCSAQTSFNAAATEGKKRQIQLLLPVFLLFYFSDLAHCENHPFNARLPNGAILSKEKCTSKLQEIFN